MDNLISLFSPVIISLALLFWIFYKSFILQLGKYQAQLVTIEHITRLQEDVKNEFNQKIENLRAELAKNNISYQITLSEITRRRFENVEILVMNLINLVDFMTEDLFIVANDVDYDKAKENFRALYKSAKRARLISNLYLTEPLILRIDGVLTSSYDAYLQFLKMYRTNPKKLGSMLGFPSEALKLRLQDENNSAFEKLQELTIKFPVLLDDISFEVKSTFYLRGFQ
jgi:hypothetical protein